MSLACCIGSFSMLLQIRKLPNSNNMDILAYEIFENNSKNRKINHKNFGRNTILYG